MSNYHLTATALVHLEEVIRSTARKWGLKQAKAYEASLEEGYKEIARAGKSIMTHFRSDMVKNTELSIHRISHHYIAFKVQDENNVIIVGLFHEKMNIPLRLKELQNKSSHEITEAAELLQERQH